MRILRKLKQLVEKFVPILLDKQTDIDKFYKNEDRAKQAFQKELDAYANKLIHQSTLDLRSLELQMKEKNLELEKQILSASSDQLEESDVQKSSYFQMAITLITRVIETKRAKNQVLTHPLVKSTVVYPTFSVSNPHEGSENQGKIVNQQGIIEVERKGFKKSVYRNKKAGGSLMTAFDQSVFLGIQKIWLDEYMKRDGESDPMEMSFSFADLVRSMGKEVNTGLYAAIEESLENIYYSDNTLIQEEDPNSKKIGKSIYFHFIQKLEIDHVHYRVSIKFSDEMVASLKKEDFISISIDQLNDFSGNAAQILYPLLNLWVQEDRSEYEMDLDNLIGHLNLISSQRAKAIQILQRAFAEMKENDIIRDYDFPKEGNKYRLVRFEFHDNYVMNYKNHRLKLHSEEQLELSLPEPNTIVN